MTSRLPFTLAPLAGEPFGLWWYTYATRLGVTRTELAHAVGIAVGQPPQVEHRAAIAAATGLAAAEIAEMFATLRPCPPEHVLRVWRQQDTSRFCPRCLANGGAWQPAWRLPLTFHCLTHHTPLAEHCGGCGQAPPGRRPPAGTADDRSCCPLCGHDLGTQADPRGRGGGDNAAHANAQKLINTLVARLRDPASTEADREQAQDDLIDLTLIALHLDHGLVEKQHGFNHRRMPDAAAFTDAAALLTDPQPGQDRLADLVTRCFRGPQSRAIPFSWRAASPALTTRIARGRDSTLTPIERIRYATTLPATAPPPRRQRTDPASRRAARLPDQLWPVWAIRLADHGPTRRQRDTVDGPVFRSAMIAALLLPDSNLPLKQITPLLPHQPDAKRVAHQLRHLAATPGGDLALRILTELGLALDHHDIPIDYARRRRLAADTDLIDKPTWSRLCRDAGLRPGRARRLDLARSYLYELITGGGLATAPEPYRLPEGTPRVEHVEFCATLPAAVAAALTGHANKLLAVAGITGEPLTWHPPADWVTVASWPGADPELTDPGPLHRAMLARWATAAHNNWRPTQAVADTLGISSHHLRYVLRKHPIDHAPYTERRPGAVIAAAFNGAGGHRTDPHPDHPERVYLVDPAWLREQYITCRRTLIDIAIEIGCHKAVLRRFAHAHHIPIRPRSGAGGFIATDTAPGLRTSELPEPLRHALLGHAARQRLHRFTVVAGHASLNQAAQALGAHISSLLRQIDNLERVCGGPLIHRRSPPHSYGGPTPLGEELCRQAREHLGLAPT